MSETLDTALNVTDILLMIGFMLMLFSIILNNEPLPETIIQTVILLTAGRIYATKR